MRQSRSSKTQRPSPPKECERCKELLQNGDPDEYFFCDECGKMLRPPKLGSEKLDFDDIPLPAIFEIMLNLDRKELHYLCTSNKVANKICKEPRFRDEYNERHAAGLFNTVNPFHIEATFRNHRNYWVVSQDGLAKFRENTVEFKDNKNGTIEIRYIDEFNWDESIYLVLKRKKPFGKNHLYLRRRRNEDGEKYLNYFGKKRWFPTSQEGLNSIKGDVRSKEYLETELPEAAADEFLDIMKKAYLSSKDHPDPFWALPDVFFQDKRALRQKSSKQQGGKLSRKRSKRRSRNRRSKR